MNKFMKRKEQEAAVKKEEIPSLPSNYHQLLEAAASVAKKEPVMKKETTNNPYSFPCSSSSSSSTVPVATTVPMPMDVDMFDNKDRSVETVPINHTLQNLKRYDSMGQGVSPPHVPMEWFQKHPLQRISTPEAVGMANHQDLPQTGSNQIQGGVWKGPWSPEMIAMMTKQVKQEVLNSTQPQQNGQMMYQQGG